MTVPPQSVTRRRVTTGLAWSAPAVAAAVAAPLASASPCRDVSQTVAWNSPQYTRGSDTQGVYQAPAPAGAIPESGLRVTVTARYGSNMTSGALDAPNANLVPSNNGVQGGTSQYLAFHQRPLVVTTTKGRESPNGWDFSLASMTSTTRQNNTGAYTVTFDRPVTNLTFTLMDIDSAGGGTADPDFYDIVWATGSLGGSPVPFTGSLQNTGHLTGSGSVTDPWRARNSNAPVAGTSASGNVTVRFASAVTSFTIFYAHGVRKTGGRSDPDQAIFLSNLEFTTSTCV
ncbi:hypothetical protein SAMN04487849_10246 [Micrococcus luteus]|uniref:Tat pathway signal sequence domain protein n=1 Tax=Micrococcus luteus TaxID=1270 RepID=A0ABD7M5V5_MICLU|nr:hypothetical protein [Micrococcus luteus]MCV7635511.1 hypothetical protein [Micrococcus luteus]SHL37314.1 hypothetical protein SAMN04487849_10246 [Micrococcus luteus]